MSWNPVSQQFHWSLLWFDFWASTSAYPEPLGGVTTGQYASLRASNEGLAASITQEWSQRASTCCRSTPLQKLKNVALDFKDSLLPLLYLTVWCICNRITVFPNVMRCAGEHHGWWSRNKKKTKTKDVNSINPNIQVSLVLSAILVLLV